MMSYKVSLYIALVLLIVQVTISNAAPGKAQGGNVATRQAPPKVASLPKVAAPVSGKKCICVRENGKCKDPNACKNCAVCKTVPAASKKVPAVQPRAIKV